jgi:flagellar biosynthesis anti-sigma factor FlgM
MPNDVSGVSTPNLQLISNRGNAKGDSVGADASSQKTPSGPSQESTVNLSGPATLKAMEQRIADTPVVDAVKVRATREAIAAGDFTIDPSRVADKMLALEGMIDDKISE